LGWVGESRPKSIFDIFDTHPPLYQDLTSKIFLESDIKLHICVLDTLFRCPNELKIAPNLAVQKLLRSEGLFLLCFGEVLGAFFSLGINFFWVQQTTKIAQNALILFSNSNFPSTYEADTEASTIILENLPLSSLINLSASSHIIKSWVCTK